MIKTQLFAFSIVAYMMPLFVGSHFVLKMKDEKKGHSMMNTEKNSKNEKILIIVASSSGSAHENQFLVLKSSRDDVFWVAIDINGKEIGKGHVKADGNKLKKAFEEASVAKSEKIKPDAWYYFSLVLIDGNDIRACKLLGIEHQEKLIHGNELRELFNEIRKKVYGKRHYLHYLLRIGMDGQPGDCKDSQPERKETYQHQNEKHCPGPRVGKGDIESAGQNRQGVADERAVRERASDPSRP